MSMSARNRAVTLPLKGISQIGLAPQILPSQVVEPHFGRGLLPALPHHGLFDERRETQLGIDPMRILDDRLTAQHQDIQALLAENQRLAATHVALKQEMEVAEHALQVMTQVSDSLHPDKDAQVRELQEKYATLEADLNGIEATRGELKRVCADIIELNDAKQDLSGRMQGMTQDLLRYSLDLQQIPVLKMEIQSVKQELHHARAAIEYEKKIYAENYELGQVMEKKLVAMARELEKLRAEAANAEMRARTEAANQDTRARNAAAAGNTGATYNANYGNLETGYPANMYPSGYGMSAANAESYPQQGSASAAAGGWSMYDMQRAHGHR